MKKTNYVRVNKLPMNKLLTTITLLCFSVAANAQLTPPQSTGEAFTLKLLKRTGENFFPVWHMNAMIVHLSNLKT
jgi:hypothetical protein